MTKTPFLCAHLRTVYAEHPQFIQKWVAEKYMIFKKTLQQSLSDDHDRLCK